MSEHEQLAGVPLTLKEHAVVVAILAAGCFAWLAIAYCVFKRVAAQ